MYPAFRSEKSAFGFCLLIVFLLVLPFLLFRIGLPPREDAYKSIPVKYGAPGREVEAIYRNKRNPDVLFLGSSLVMNAVLPGPLEAALSHHLGRPAYVEVLGMAWQGVDLQYFILRDYLQHHQPGVIIFNPPAPGGAPKSPHPVAYRWFRYGEFQNDFTGVSMRNKMEIYGHMVLGGPRDLLSRLRPNLIAPNETSRESYIDYLKNERDLGYMGSPFVFDSASPSKDEQAILLPLNSPLISTSNKPLPAYSVHFFRMILALAKSHHCKLVFMHIPEDREFDDPSIPEDSWGTNGAGEYEMIGVPAKTLYAGMSKERFLHFYADGHLNKNGDALFTAAITPAVTEAYDEANDESHVEPKLRSQVRFPSRN